ncbi:C2 domain containing protein [Acanthamoeba castellanii str. Neff]|uniref:C2 domain containing protein n=1 Tax=Acanthamoeba castellanii (strain ATCC 30010 / Neff) TaxID=1257118 RepID=L8GZ45_ACACF|nr:C2 domain containing protein [Acanthamoeba castellanii str. Neff]ELR18265.1 C2 domain containing protein [Acanthamoeba castellanii str. Neff]
MGKNLVSADSNGYSDPYVVIAVAGEEKKNFKKTATIKKTLNPVWNESFEFELGSTPTHRQVTFHVYDWDMLSSDDSLGNISLPVDDLYIGVEKQEWHTLYNVDHGQINVALTALDFGLEREGGEEEYEQGYPPRDSAPAPQDYHSSSSSSSSFSSSGTHSPSVSRVKGDGFMTKSGKASLKAGKAGLKAGAGAAKVTGKAAGTFFKGVGTVLSVVEIFSDD